MSLDSNDDRDEDEEYLDDPNIFHIWDPLQQPVTIQYTTEQLHSRRAIFSIVIIYLIHAEMIHQGDIDLDPEYQRGQFV
jgi:hypothetical protein